MRNASSINQPIIHKPDPLCSGDCPDLSLSLPFQLGSHVNVLRLPRVVAKKNLECLIIIVVNDCAGLFVYAVDLIFRVGQASQVSAITAAKVSEDGSILTWQLAADDVSLPPAS